MSASAERTKMDVTEARASFGQLQERVRDEQYILVTKRGKEAFAVVDIEFFEALLETVEIISDPESYQLFQQSLEDIRSGRVIEHDEIKKEFL